MRLLQALLSFVITFTVFLATSSRPASAVASKSAADVIRTAQLTCVPAKLRFGAVTAGLTRPSAVTITNSSSSSVTISQAIIVGAGFSLSGLNLPLVLPAGSGFTFAVSFTPKSTGVAHGTLYLVSNAVDQVLTIPLTGEGTDEGQLLVAPATMNFGNVYVGSYASQTGALSAVGSAVTVSSGTINSSLFALSGLFFPVTIPAGQSISFTVMFTPQNNGQASANLSFTSDASNSPTIESLTGTGVPEYTVNLSWTASNSHDVVGYNIYRGNASGGPYSQINTNLDPNTAYTDNTVVSGQTYYYVATAVNSSNQESVYSNQAQAVVP